MNQHFVKEYKTAMKKIINSESRTIAKTIESIDKSEKIKENFERIRAVNQSGKVSGCNPE